MNASPNNSNPEERLTRFIDGETNHAEQPEWLTEKEAALNLGSLLRANLPARMEPPSEEFFTSQIMQRISEELPAAAPIHRNSAAPSFFERFRMWFAPLATAAAVLVVGGYALKNRSAASRDSFAYTPIPNVTATLSFDEEAEATVINLDGLEPIADDRDIKAFNVASSENVTPGEPQQFFAANDPNKLLFVLFPSDNQAPKIHEVH